MPGILSAPTSDVCIQHPGHQFGSPAKCRIGAIASCSRAKNHSDLCVMSMPKGVTMV